MTFGNWKKWLACLITLTLLGTLFVPGAFCVLAEETVETAEETQEVMTEESFPSEDTSDGSYESQSGSSEEYSGSSSEEYDGSSSEESSGMPSGSSSESSAEIPEVTDNSEDSISEMPDSESAIEYGTVEEGEVPDGEEFSEEDISGYSEGESDELNPSGKAASHMAEAFPDDRKFRTLTYENKKISVKLMLQNEDAVPENAQLIVRPVKKSDRSYSFDKYMEALNFYEAWENALIEPEEEETITYEEVLRRMEEPYYRAENTLLYDVVIQVPVKEGLITKMVEVLPKSGLVKLTFTFKEDQLADLKVMEREDVSVMYLPFNEKIRKENESTRKVKDPAVSDIEPEEITCKVLLYGLDDVEKDEVSFVAPGASVFAIRSDKVEVPPVEEMEAAEDAEAVEDTEAVEASENTEAAEDTEEVEDVENAEAVEDTEAAEETENAADGLIAEESDSGETVSTESEISNSAEIAAKEETTEAEDKTENEAAENEPAEVVEAENFEITPAAAKAKGAQPSEDEQPEPEKIIAKRPNGLEAAFSRKKLADFPVTRTGVATDGRPYVELAAMKVLVDGKSGELARDTEWPLEGFAFSLSTESGTAQEGMTLPVNTTVEVDVSDPVAHFEAVYFDREGTYKLLIKEVLPEDIVDKVSGSIYYNTDVHTATVEVVNDNGLQIADVQYDVSSDGEESYSELYILNELLETADAAELSVRKLQSNNGVKSSVYVKGAQLYILDVEANEIAVDPVTGMEISWETQTSDETFWLEPGHYRLIEQMTPTARHNYWKTITPVEFVVDEGKIYLGNDPDAAGATLVTNPMILYDDFDLKKYMADVDAVIDGSGDNSGNSGGSGSGNSGNGNNSEQGVSEEEPYPTKAPQGSDIGVDSEPVETGKVAKKSSSSKKSSSKKSSSSSSSSGSSNSSSGSSSGSSSRTVSVSTGDSSSSSSSDSADSANGESSTTRTVTVRTGVGGDESNGATGTPDPNNPNATGTPTGTSVATVSVNGTRATAGPNTTIAATTEDTAGRGILLWMLAAACSLAAVGYSLKRIRK